jgi:hypothetical protein
MSLGYVIRGLVYNYLYFDLTWSDLRAAFLVVLLGLAIGGPVLIARFVAEKKPFAGAIAMLVLSIPFVVMPIIMRDTPDLLAFVGLIYVVPAVLYLLSWRTSRL